MNANWLWDRKIDDAYAREILVSPQNNRFIEIAAILFARKSSPKEVFKEYISPENFCLYWARIKKKMRTDSWNNPRIEFWQAIYESIMKKLKGEGRNIDFHRNPPDIDEFYIQIGSQLKKYRKEMGLNQKEIAEKMGISQQIISRIESGRYNVSLGALKRITSALGLEMEVKIKPVQPRRLDKGSGLKQQEM